jgi:cytochrome c nitrite reductase small subunit
LMIALTILLIAVVMFRPALTAARGGKVLAFVALFLFPIGVAFMGASEHMERSHQTEFCLSCHIMESYGKSLGIDDAQFLPAAHFQNARIPRDQACFACHADYALYGTISDKWRGMHHVNAQYIGHPANPIHLYTPFNNRECLHCHAGARSFEEGVVHNADPSIMAGIKSNQLSCLSIGCHTMVHNVAHISEMKFWPQPNDKKAPQ